MEFKVFIHSKDVVENILSDARNDSHLVGVMEFALKQDDTQTSIEQPKKDPKNLEFELSS